MLWWTLRQLGSGNAEARARAAEMLAGSREARVVESLVMALADEEALVRAAAAKSLGKIGDAQAIEPLVAALLDTDKRVRAAAAKALGMMNWQPANDRHRAMQAIAEDQWDTVVSLGTQVVDLLLTALNEGDIDLKQKAAQALGQLGDLRAVEPLLSILRGTEIEIKHKAAQALGQLGDLRAVDMLLAALFDPNSDELRVSAARALGQLGDPQALDPLTSAREDKEMPVRVAAVKAIGQIGGTDGIKRLIQSLGHPYQEVRAAAVQMLAQIGAPAVEPVMAVINDRRLREMAQQALVEIGAPAVEVLLEAAEESQMRETALNLLQKIGPRAVKPLVLLTKDPLLQEAAFLFLVDMGIAAVEPLAEAALDDQIRAPAFEMLMQIGTPALEPLVRILHSLPARTGQSEMETRPRADVVFDALVLFGPPAALSLAGVLTHPGVYIRRRATRALGLIGDAASIQPLLELAQDKHVAKNVVDSLRQIVERHHEHISEDDLHALAKLDGVVQYIYAQPNSLQPSDAKMIDCGQLHRLAAQELQRRRGVVV